ncbi:MAG: pyrimidine dimer DNA glycosylase/endonuclease V [Clostridia bacterium]|nr:pyrimidine dimer DNA glycosylase/endonuclease V [Clostridia bacterium]
MRLWHYKLIPVLPNAMLVSQWRECIAIKRQWEKGTLKHRLVSYVMDYDKSDFLAYVNQVVSELQKRNIKYQQKYVNELVQFSHGWITLDEDFHYPEHNDKYFTQCYYNLEEKHDRGIISDEEWQKIQKLESECRIHE